MKQRFCLCFTGLLFSLTVVAQQNTDIFLASLTTENDSLAIGKIFNISNNEGYDNQPSFYDKENILFSSTRNGQTDIALYNIKNRETSWLSNTPKGSEYSPLKIPGKEAVSAIRLDEDGLQRLYAYDFKTGKSTEILKDLKVGYHVWYNENIIVSSVLVEDRMDLVVSNLKDRRNHTVQKNIGRSLHKIPQTNLISFASKENDSIKIKSIDPISGAIKDIKVVLGISEDVCWTPDGTLISANENMLIGYHPSHDKAWRLLHRFDEKEMYAISRMAVSPDGKHMALVSQDPPFKIVQQQVDFYNAGNLDAFVNCYDENVLVSKFPADTMYVGHKKMHDNYSTLSPDKKKYNVKVVKRMTIGNKVIDQEKITGNGEVTMQIAIYEVADAIESMTFIFDEKDSPNPEPIVQKQLEAYNTRDVEAFLATYSDTIKIYDFPNNIRTDGKKALQKGYADFFKSTVDLHCEIKNRIVINNKVIDEEEITANGKTFNAVAIYEIEDGKIAKVTFVR